MTMSKREMRYWCASHLADVLLVGLIVGLIVYVVRFA